MDNIIGNELANIMGDQEESIITRKDNIPSKLKMNSENIRYSNNSKGNETVMSKMENSDRIHLKNNTMNLKNISKIQLQTLPDKEITLTQSFKPVKQLQSNKKFERLHSQTKYRGVSSPFLAADFRGLLITDYNEALNNWSNNYKTLTKIDKEKLGGTRIRIGKYKSNATKEMFPSPFDLTKHWMNSKMRLSKGKFGISSKTATGFYSTNKNTGENEV